MKKTILATLLLLPALSWGQGQTVDCRTVTTGGTPSSAPNCYTSVANFAALSTIASQYRVPFMVVSTQNDGASYRLAADLTTWSAWPSAANIPAPTPSTLGGVNSKAAASHQFLTQVGTDGSVSAAQPAAADVSGLAAIATSGSANDLSNATPPLLQTTTLTNQGNSPYWLTARQSDGVLFAVLTNDPFVKAYSLANPAVPVLLGSVSVGSSSAYIGQHGNYVYVTNQSSLTLQVIDATNPASMSVVATITYQPAGGTGGGRFDISPDGNHMLIGGAETGSAANQAVLVDISNPLAPAVVGQTPTTGSTHRGVAAINSTTWALASRDDSTVRVISAATPSAPVQVAQITTTVGATTTPLLYDSSRSILFVGQFQGSPVGAVLAYNMATPTSPAFLGSLLTDTGSEEIARAGNLLTVGLRNTNQIALVDTTSPAAMVLVTKVTPTGSPTTTPGTAQYGGYAYLTAAGDTTNGKIYAFAVEPLLLATINGLVAQNSALAAQVAYPNSANNFTATQQMSAATALNLSSNSACISLGTTSPDTICRNATAQLTYNGLLIANGGFVSNNAGAGIRFKTNVSNAQYNYVGNTNGDMFYSDGTNAADARTGRTAAGLWGMETGKFTAFGGGFGLVGGAGIAPTAKIEAGAGTSAAGTASLKIDPGALTTVAESGAVENDGRFTLTDTTLSRSRVSNVLFEQTGTQSIANTSTATTLFGSGQAAGGGLTLTNNYLSAGRTLRVTLQGVYSAQATPGNATVTVLLGGTTVATATITNLPSGGISGGAWEATVYIVCRTTGGSGTAMTSGKMNYDLGSGSAGFVALNNGGTTTTINTASSYAVDVRWSWATASSSNTISSVVATVEGL